MTGLTEEMELIIGPMDGLAKRLSAAERALWEQVREQIIEACKDEEREANQVFAIITEMEQRLEDVDGTA